ncbi:MAG TPA: superoxide dismutase [Candidatus Saccharimonadales bacterium]|nr:superoxide dismutase [Candidatus Saccharimonadales bacterium]
MFELPALPYGYDALGKYISKDIMELHHNKHHQTYVDNLNKIVTETPELHGKSIEELLLNLDSLPENARTVVRNHGGGHYNHSQFWVWMSPEGGHEPSGELADAIKSKYGSYQAFVDQFSERALKVFGSGWAWLNPDLTITSSANQDSPLMNGGQAPILGLDVWEHAYYLDYKSNRGDYIKAWWNVVNWPEVEKRYLTKSV